MTQSDAMNLCFRKFNPAGLARCGRISASSDAMFAIIQLLAMFIADLFKPARRLEVENLFLRHQLNIALRRGSQRVRLRVGDRALMVCGARHASMVNCSSSGSRLPSRRSPNT